MLTYFSAYVKWFCLQCDCGLTLHLVAMYTCCHRPCACEKILGKKVKNIQETLKCFAFCPLWNKSHDRAIFIHGVGCYNRPLNWEMFVLVAVLNIFITCAATLIVSPPCAIQFSWLQCYNRVFLRRKTDHCIMCGKIHGKYAESDPVKLNHR